MSWISKIIYYFLKTAALKSAVDSAKKNGILIYLKVLKVARQSLLGAFLVIVAVQTMVLGFFGTVLTLVFLAPLEHQERLYLVLAICGILFLAPLVVFLMAFSEKRWLTASGAIKMMEELEG